MIDYVFVKSILLGKSEGVLGDLDRSVVESGIPGRIWQILGFPAKSGDFGEIWRFQPDLADLGQIWQIWGSGSDLGPESVPGRISGESWDSWESGIPARIWILGQIWAPDLRSGPDLGFRARSGSDLGFRGCFQGPEITPGGLPEAARDQIWARSGQIWVRSGVWDQIWARSGPGPGFRGPESATLATVFWVFWGAAGLLINVFFGQVLVCFLVRRAVWQKLVRECVSGPDLADLGNLGIPGNLGFLARI